VEARRVGRACKTRQEFSSSRQGQSSVCLQMGGGLPLLAGVSIRPPKDPPAVTNLAVFERGGAGDAGH
jgi:hypothetical protein